MPGAVTGNAFGSAGRRAAGVPLKAVVQLSGSGWNTKDFNSAMRIFGAALFVNSSPGSDVAGRGTKSSYGRSYLEYVVSTSPNSAPRIMCGLGNSQSSLANYPGSSNYGIGYFQNGNIYYGGSAIYQGASPLYAFDVVGVAYDGTYVYFSYNGTYINSQNPTTQNNGFSAPSGPLFPMISGEYRGDGATLITALSSMVYGPPSGFQAWG